VFLYDETIRVPLLFKLPAGRAAGKRVETRVELVDVAPTILRAVGVSVPEGMQGQSLLAIMKSAGPSAAKAGSPEERPAYAETDYPHRAFGWSSLRALRSGKYLYIRAPERELYNQATDPQEQQNLASNSKAVADTLAAQLDQFRNRTSQTLVELAKPDAQQLEKLQALGYVGSDTKAGASDKESGIDPKSKIEVSNLLHDAMLDVEDARYQEAVPLLEKVLKEQPDMPVAELQLGIANSRLKNYAQALAPLQRAVELLPDNGMGRYELGLALFETGDWKGAAPQFEAAVGRAPRWADAHFSLAAVYARVDRVPEAMTELDTTLGLNPEHYRANLLRGRILSLQGNAADALGNLQKAAQVQPDSREAHLFLGDAYAQLGRVMDAKREHDTAHSLPGRSPRP
jgi:tetratricopeptide (TPR) repeat protein